MKTFSLILLAIASALAEVIVFLFFALHIRILR